jgi:hypothetical protein
MALATITGTALVPGVSRNKRHYSAEVIGKAVKRATDRIAEGAMPLTMRVCHPVDEAHAPVTEIVGRITKMWQEADGRARFEAQMPDTETAREVLKLIDNRNESPYLTGVSVRGDWIGPTRMVHAPGGVLAETASDMAVDGLDLTHRPGVMGAAIEQVTDPDQPRESATEGRTRIYESVQEAQVITEADAPADKPKGPYADPGYQPDKQRRYPIGDINHARAAWSYVNQADNAKMYTPAQLKRIKARIVAALKKFGVDVEVKESFAPGDAFTRQHRITLIERRAITEALMVDDCCTQPAGMEICLNNGMVEVRVCSYRVDPADLDIVARQAMAGACAALALIDPDDDGDIDLPPIDADGNATPQLEPVAKALSAAFETASAAGVTEAEDPEDDDPDAPAEVEPEPVEPPAPSPAADPNPQEEDLVSEETTTAAVASSSPAPAAITLSTEQFEALLARLTPPAPALVGAPAEAAPAAPVIEAAAAAPTPATTPVTETEEQRIERIVNARLTEAMQRQVAQTGPPARKGLVGRVTESGQLLTAGTGTEGLNSHGLPADWPDKPLHEYKDAERDLMSRALFDYVTNPASRVQQ